MKNFKTLLENINQVLTEGSIKSIRGTVQDKSLLRNFEGRKWNELSSDEKTNAESIIEKQLKHIENAVNFCTSNPEYKSWIYDIIKDRPFLIHEDKDKIKEVLELFDTVKRSENFENKKILYYKSFSQLAKAIDEFTRSSSSMGHLNFGKNKLIYDKGMYTVLKLEDYDECKHLTEDTKWCIKGREQFNSHGAPFYMVLKDGIQYVLIHFNSNQMKDFYDDPFTDIDDDFKSLFKVILKEYDIEDKLSKNKGLGGEFIPFIDYPEFLKYFTAEAKFINYIKTGNLEKIKEIVKSKEIDKTIDTGYGGIMSENYRINTTETLMEQRSYYSIYKDFKSNEFHRHIFYLAWATKFKLFEFRKQIEIDFRVHRNNIRKSFDMDTIDDITPIIPNESKCKLYAIHGDYDGFVEFFTDDLKSKTFSGKYLNQFIKALFESATKSGNVKIFNLLIDTVIDQGEKNSIPHINMRLSEPLYNSLITSINFQSINILKRILELNLFTKESLKNVINNHIFQMNQIPVTETTKEMFKLIIDYIEDTNLLTDVLARMHFSETSPHGILMLKYIIKVILSHDIKMNPEQQQDDVFRFILNVIHYSTRDSIKKELFEIFKMYYDKFHKYNTNYHLMIYLEKCSIFLKDTKILEYILKHCSKEQIDYLNLPQMKSQFGNIKNTTFIQTCRKYGFML